MLATLFNVVFKIVGTAVLATLAVLVTLYFVIAGIASQF